MVSGVWFWVGGFWFKVSVLLWSVVSVFVFNNICVRLGFCIMGFRRVSVCGFLVYGLGFCVSGVRCLVSVLIWCVISFFVFEATFGFFHGFGLWVSIKCSFMISWFVVSFFVFGTTFELV